MRNIKQRITDFSIKGLLSFFIVAALPVLAEESQGVASSQQHTSPCGPECTCGCVQGGPCHCHDQPKQQQATPCGPDCSCGCVQGGPCHCHDQLPQQQQQPAADQSAGYNGQAVYDYNSVYASNYSSNDYGYYYDNSSYDNGCCNDYTEADYCFERTYSYIDCYGERRPTNIDPWDITYEPCSCSGIWLPDDPVLFRPFMADPRQICYSVAWRFNDNALTKNTIPVSYGDSLGIYRWCHVGPWNGNLQIDLEGGLWAVFDPCTYSAPLINADYYVGVPITYAYERWAFRLRGYHISSHIGDEFLLNHPGFDRKNPSAEYFDFFISHDFTEEIRLYAGIGYTLWQDESWQVAPFYAAIGAELRLLRWGFLDVHDRLYGCPIFAMNFRGNGEFKHHIDQTYILGYEFGKLCGLFRKLRFFIEYHDGYSLEGMFAKIATNYFSICATYGF